MSRSIRNTVRGMAGQRLDKYALTVAVTSKAAIHFGRPDWLLKRSVVPTKPKIVFRDPKPVTSKELALCERLLAAYALARTGGPQTEEGMWTQPTFQHRQRALMEPLERQDPTLLAERLAEMFRSDFVLGLSAPGSLAVGGSGLTRRIISWDALHRFVALAESQAAVPVENPEQGAAGLAFAGGINALVEATEDALGVPLDFPNIGAAYGLRLDGRLVTPETPDQLYGAARLREAIGNFLKVQESVRVVEIGGGYGGMAYWFLRMTTDARYAIVDLPLVNVMQGYFLSLALGEDAVSLCGESERQVSIVPPHELTVISTPCDVLVNKDSLPEIPRTEAIAYLAWAKQHCTGLFYSYNQEAGAVALDNTTQNVVSELVGNVEGYSRVRRDSSWLRAGYVEEIYRMGPIESENRAK
jgi:hypothetical protein